MKTLLTMLSDARSAVRAGNAAAVTRLLERIEATAQTAAIDPDQAARCRQEIAKLLYMLAAQQQGLRDAIDGVAAALRTAGSLQTYDISGQRRTETTAARKTHRF